MADSQPRKFVWLIVLIAVASVAAVVWSDRLSVGETSTQVVFITNGSDQFSEISAAGARDSAKRLGASVQVMMPQKGLVDQNRFIKELLGSDVAGVAISPIDPSRQSALLNELAGDTLLVTHDSDAPYAKRLCYVGMDNYTAGKACGKLVEEAMPGGGTVMISIGNVNQDNARLRRQGLIDVLMGRPDNPTGFDPIDQVLVGERYTIVGTLTDHHDLALAKANAVQALKDHPDLGCMVGMFGYSSPLCLEALKESGKNGAVKLVAFDENDATLQGIVDGDIYATLVQDPYQFGFQSVRILVRKARGDDTVLPLSGALYFRAMPIRQADVEIFKIRLNKQLSSGNQ